MQFRRMVAAATSMTSSGCRSGAPEDGGGGEVNVGGATGNDDDPAVIPK